VIRPARPLATGIVAAVVALAAILRFGFFALEPPGRDQGLFVALADGALHGKLVYRDLWEHKPPGVVGLYAIAMLVFGRGYIAIQLLQALFALAASLAIAHQVRRATDCVAASLFAALLYLVFAAGLSFGGFWGTAQPEVFMDLPVIGAVAWLLGARAAPAVGVRRGAAAGLCVGWAILLKYSAAPLVGLGLLVWVGGGASVRDRVRATAAFALGCLAPGAALAGSMAALGAWDDFFRATVIFNAAHRAASASPGLPLLSELFYAPDRLAPLYVPAAIGAIAAAIAPRREGDGRGRELGLAAALLWLLAIAEVFWQRKFWIYHYQVIALPLALLAGVGLSWVQGAAKTPRAQAAVAAASAVALALLGIPYARDLLDYDAYHGVSARWRGIAAGEEVEATYVWGGRDYAFAQTRAVSEWLAREVPAGEPIFVWGFEPYVYFLSGRAPASRFLYDYPLMPRFASAVPWFRPQLLDDLHRHPPAAFVVVANDPNDIEPIDSATQLRQWGELREFVRSGYHPVWQVGDFRCLLRNGIAAPDPASAPR
jgi:hypothetical protein